MNENWPELPLAAWQKTYDTLHLWTQVIGKIRIARTPLINHWWNSALYLNGRGLTTSPIPYDDRAFEIAFDFVDHRLTIDTSWGTRRTIDLQLPSCAEFWESVMKALAELNIEVEIHPLSCELPEPIRLDLDREHATYDREWATRWWRITLAVHNVLQEFRGRFIGKCSPVHFFWGSFDLAVTRSTARPASQSKSVSGGKWASSTMRSEVRSRTSGSRSEGSLRSPE